MKENYSEILRISTPEPAISIISSHIPSERIGLIVCLNYSQVSICAEKVPLFFDRSTRLQDIKCYLKDIVILSVNIRRSDARVYLAPETAASVDLPCVCVSLLLFQSAEAHLT